jgi:hypothetical protein
MRQRLMHQRLCRKRQQWASHSSPSSGFFLHGFFFGCGEDDGTGEAVAVRIREWASVEGEKEGLYKDKDGMYRNTRPLCTAAACTVTRG